MLSQPARQVVPTCPLVSAAAKSGSLVQSGFQANLSALLVRLGVDHPHHSLYQVGGEGIWQESLEER